MRPLWSGSLSFGLINIPLKLYSASRPRPLNFRMLEKHSQCEIQFKRICFKNHKEVAYEDVVKGYEYRKGDYVVLTDEDFKKATRAYGLLLQALERTNKVAIAKFVMRDKQHLAAIKNEAGALI